VDKWCNALLLYHFHRHTVQTATLVTEIHYVSRPVELTCSPGTEFSIYGWGAKRLVGGMPPPATPLVTGLVLASSNILAANHSARSLATNFSYEMFGKAW